MSYSERYSKRILFQKGIADDFCDGSVVRSGAVQATGACTIPAMDFWLITGFVSGPSSG